MLEKELLASPWEQSLPIWASLEEMLWLLFWIHQSFPSCWWVTQMELHVRDQQILK